MPIYISDFDVSPEGEDPDNPHRESLKKVHSWSHEYCPYLAGFVEEVKAYKERLGKIHVPHFFIYWRVRLPDNSVLYYRFDRFTKFDRLTFVEYEEGAIEGNRYKAKNCVPELVTSVRFSCKVSFFSAISLTLWSTSRVHPFEKMTYNCLWLCGQYMSETLFKYATESEEGCGKISDCTFSINDFVNKKMQGFKQQPCLWLLMDIPGCHRGFWKKSWLQKFSVTQQKVKDLQQQKLLEASTLVAELEQRYLHTQKELEEAKSSLEKARCSDTK